MKTTTYVYYPGFAIALLIFILNLSQLTNIDYVWIMVPLFFGWVTVKKLNYYQDVVIWFPLIKKLLK